MMDLNELRELVNFMKEHGLSELEYKEKHASVRLKLAPPAPPFFGHRRPGPEPLGKEPDFEPVPPRPDEEPPRPEMDMEELKAAAKSAARKAAHKAADGMETVAAYVKARLPEEEEGPEHPAPEPPEAAPGEDAQPLKQAGEAVWNTVKAGAILGKASAKRGRERLLNLFQYDRPAKDASDECEPLDEDDSQA